ncbi:hypothetical protein FSP39_017136 [Pinctada imbricata]|uniref:B box-type domain-containing protein n=1 Tax=Pinctada imbricata TaxID=66713 RepID=A0AA88XDJ6_PINIB|nr:hypothetical protein FSP39_017136 [Pinctada imbricata]
MAEVGVLVQNPIPTCENHPSDEVEVYCKDCAKAVCFNCSRNHHRNHDCEGIARLSRLLRQQIPETCKQIRDGTLSKMTSELESIQSIKQANKEKNEQERSANEMLQDEIVKEVKRIFKRNADKASEKLNKQNEALNVREQELMKEIDEIKAHVQTHQDSQLTYGKWEIIEMDEKLRKMTMRYGSLNTMDMTYSSSTSRHLTTKQKDTLEKCIHSIIPQTSGGVSSENIVGMSMAEKTRTVPPRIKYKDRFNGPTFASSYGIPAVSIVPRSHIKMPVYFISMITTSSDTNSSLLQLSILTSSGHWNWYVEPSKPVSKQVEEVTGIKYSDSGSMYVSGRKVESLPPGQVLHELLDVLGEETAYLIGHSIRSHGCYVMIEAATIVGLNDRMERHLTHMVDMVTVARHHNRRLKAQLTLEELSETILGRDIIRNDAGEDVNALKIMFEELNPSEYTLQECMFDYKYVMNTKRINEEKLKNLESWRPLIAKGAIPKKIAEKAARNGINVWDLQTAYKDGGEAKLTSILSEKDETNEPKVTNRKESIHQLCAFFKKLQS